MIDWSDAMNLDMTVKVRQDLALIVYENTGQKLLDELAKYCQIQYDEGYEDAQIIMQAPMDVGCEFD
jgi:hypothetical protein